MNDENRSLMDYMSYFFDEVSNLDFGDLFPIVGDSVLTTFVLFFLAGWILSICVSLGRRGWK